MSKGFVQLVLIAVVLGVLIAAAPALIALAHAAVPVVVAIGVVACVLRLVWYLTSRY